MMWELAGVYAAGRPWVIASFAAQVVFVVVRLVWLYVMYVHRAWGSPAAFVGYWVLSVVIGLANAAIVLSTVSALDPLQQSMLTVCLCGINTIGVVSMASSPTVYATHASWNLVALLWASLAQPIPGFWYVYPVMVIVYIAALAMMTVFVHASLRGQILLGLKLREAALRDPLTGLRNRRALDEAMTVEVARIERARSQPGVREGAPRGMAFLLIDMDNFKGVNDGHGHAAGVAVLAQLAALMLEATRRVDLVARWGGEEFLVVATDVDPAAGFPLPERIRARVQERPFALPGGKTMHCTCSIGVAWFPVAGAAPGATWEGAVADADRALYAAKARGRNRVVHVDELAATELTPAA
jgi:diguanylate cyclase (GGDEF)-like protein